MVNIFNIQKYSVDDGPGIRTTIFFKGCPLQCRWCHNPEGQQSEIEISFKEQLCINCKNCEKVCREKAHIFNRSHIFLREKCNLCMECVNNCPSGALTSFGKDIDIESLEKKILEDNVFYKFSGGGVTFSGGEPTYQIKELKNILVKCKKNHIHTTLETCGYFDLKEFNKLLIYLDQLIFDLKILNSEVHLKYTGKKNELILNNLLELSKNMEHILVRIPVIPLVNTDTEEIKKIINFINYLNGDIKVELLKFNNLGISKYKQIGRKYEFVPILDNDNKIFLQVLGQYREYLGDKVINDFKR